jgi:CDP-diacylglycerol--glycerol-3-phosphate 3-phosphatidyltransferase
VQAGTSAGQSGPGGRPWRRVPLVNLANALTVLRLVLVPVFVAFVIASDLTKDGWRMAGCVTFIVASATDFADGYIARRWQLITPFGKIADPIADKTLTGTALIILSAYGRLPWWVTIVILIREWGITAMRLGALRRQVLAAGRGGKVKTALQILAIAWYIWPMPGPLTKAGPWLMGVALVVTMVTGIDYVISELRPRPASRTSDS